MVAVARSGRRRVDEKAPSLGRETYVDLFNAFGSVDLVADVQGFFYDRTPPNWGNLMTGAVTAPPVRVLDTRSGLGSPARPVGANATLTLKVAGVGAVPRSARPVLVNLTGTGPTASTYLTAYGDGPLPVSSTLSLVRGETRPLLTLVPVDADGCIHLHNFSGSVHLTADLEGCFG